MCMNRKEWLWLAFLFRLTDEEKLLSLAFWKYHTDVYLSFHLKRFVILKVLNRRLRLGLSWGSSRRSPRSPNTPPQFPLPSTPSASQYRRLRPHFIEPSNFLLHMVLRVGRQLLRTDWITYAVVYNYGKFFSLWNVLFYTLDRLNMYVTLLKFALNMYFAKRHPVCTQFPCHMAAW